MVYEKGRFCDLHGAKGIEILRECQGKIENRTRVYFLG